MRLTLDTDDDLIFVRGEPGQWMNTGQLRRYIKSLERMLTVQEAQAKDRLDAIRPPVENKG